MKNYCEINMNELNDINGGANIKKVIVIASTISPLLGLAIGSGYYFNK